eukprot:g4416.t1
MHNKGVTIAWCPKACDRALIAAGTKEGAGGSFDDHGAELQLLEIDFNVQNSLKLVGEIKSDVKFESLTWGRSYGPWQLGLLGGGMADGSVAVWNPFNVLHGDSATSKVTRITCHEGKTSIVRFNPHSHGAQLLASGGTDHKVYIVDLGKTDQPDMYSPCHNSEKCHSAPISSLSWNKQVIHILASASTDGNCVIWDLRQKRPWCELRDPLGTPLSKIQWNPPGSSNVLLLTVSNSDNNCIIKVWDLRKSTTTPMAELNNECGHKKGIIDVCWSCHDDGLIVSSGKDNRTIVWNLFDTSEITEVNWSCGGKTESHPIVGNNFNGVNKSQRQTFGANEPMITIEPPGMYNTSLNAGSRELAWSPTIPGLLAACTFDRELQVRSIIPHGTRPPKWFKRPCGIAFGFGGKLATHAMSNYTINIKTLTLENEIDHRDELLHSLWTNNYSEFCALKNTHAKTEDSKDVWEFLKTQFSTNMQSDLLHYLRNNYPNLQEYNDLNIDERDSKFEKDKNADVDHKILQMIAYNELDAAVNFCVEASQLSKAFMIATIKNVDLGNRFASIQKAYIQQRPSVLSRVLEGIVKNDISNAFDVTDNLSWRLQFAIFCAYAPSDQFKNLCNKLATTLEHSDKQAASLCWICSLNGAKLSTSWIVGDGENMPKLDYIEMCFRIVILYLVSDDKAGILYPHLIDFARFLASIHQLDLAYSILKILRQDEVELKLLRFRVYWAQSNSKGHPPKDPFIKVNRTHDNYASQTTQNEIDNSIAFEGINSTNVHQNNNLYTRRISNSENSATKHSQHHMHSSPSDTRAKLAKYQRDGFITSVGNMQLAAKYGNRDVRLSRPIDLQAKKIDPSTENSESVNDILASLEQLSISLQAVQLRGILAKKIHDADRARDAIMHKNKNQRIHPEICVRLNEMSVLLGEKKYREALQSVQLLTLQYWSEHKDWLKPLKSSLDLAIRGLTQSL